MTKTQAKATIRKMYDEGVLGKLNSIITDAIEALEDFYNECEETRDGIEPYENKDDLTEKQQERYDWFDDLISDLDEIKDSLDTMQGELGDYESRLTERD